MESMSMLVDENEVHHGGRNCDWQREQTFRCEHCKRTVCYCGGHDCKFASKGHNYCDDCCPCDAPPPPPPEPPKPRTDEEAWAATDSKLRGQVLDRLFVRRAPGQVYNETPLTKALALARGILVTATWPKKWKKA